MLLKGDKSKTYKFSVKPEVMVSFFLLPSK